MSKEPVSIACARWLFLFSLVALTISLSSTANPSDKQVLQGYVREIPAQTKIAVIFDSFLDSASTHDGEEFSVTTAEDLTIDGQIVVPAGSIIKGRYSRIKPIAKLNGTNFIQLKFENLSSSAAPTVQIPIVANLVVHGGLLHVRRGSSDVAIHCTSYHPILVGHLIGGHSQPDMKWRHRDDSLYIDQKPTVPLGVQPPSDVLFGDKGKTFELQTRDELKIELAEALRVPQSP